ncbi:MAG: ADP-ribosylglycohydrolase family protein [Bacteroidetes bacterium]|nr:ADP-ribosylglycohydrolase family protein [Bacteroidota bacterium]
MIKSKTIAIFCLYLFSIPGVMAQHISNKELRDKIAGGWAGKMIGVTYGAPVEFRAQGITYEDPITWKPSDVIGAMWQDDLYVQLTFLMTIDKYGLEAPPSVFQELFAKSGYPLWHANVQARKNYFDGIYPPQSGMPENNLHADDIDFQIEADYLGLMCPGMPVTAENMASRIGHIMNYGDGVYGGVFLSALYTLAFFETDINQIVSDAMHTLPAESDYSKTIADVILLHNHYPSDWRAAWKELYQKWGKENICEAGSTFNIDAKINGAFVVMGLLYGDGDPLKTMEISARCGQDADCNPSSAMAVVGVVKGLRSLPQEFQDAVKKMGDSLFINTNYSFNKAVDQTLKYAKELCISNGGKANEDGLDVKVQPLHSVAMEASFPDMIFRKRVSAFHSNDWDFKGNWQNSGNSQNAETAKFSDQKGDEATFAFTGTGVSIIGNWFKSGGKADVYIDGSFKKSIDCYFHYANQEHENINICHVLNLPEGKHTIKLVVKGEKRPESLGAGVYISGAIVYSKGRKPHEEYKFSFQQ